MDRGEIFAYAVFGAFVFFLKTFFKLSWIVAGVLVVAFYYVLNEWSHQDYLRSRQPGTY
jgi:hypothetical protein